MSAPRPLSDADLDALIGKLDLETKVRLLSGSGAWTTEAVPEIGLRALTVSDGPVGVRGGTDTELDPSAALPNGSALAATWDEELLGRIGGLLATEAARKGVDVVLGPTINLHRSPLGGRHSSASPRTRCSPAGSPPPTCAASRRRGSAPAPSTTSPTTPRPTG